MQLHLKTRLVYRHLRTNLPLEFSGKLKSWHEKNNKFQLSNIYNEA